MTEGERAVEVRRRSVLDWGAIVVAAISLLGVATDGFFGLIGERNTAGTEAQTELINTLSARVTELEDSLRLMQAQRQSDLVTIEALKTEKVEREAQLQAMTLTLATVVSATPEQVMVAFLDGLRVVPSWCKKHYREDDSIRMRHINRAYEDRYNFTNERYRGQRDVVVHGEELGSEYETNDRRILQNKSFEIVDETVIANGIETTDRFLKFWVGVAVGEDYVAETGTSYLEEYICGIRIDIPEADTTR